MVPEAVTRYGLLEEWHLSWAEDEARAAYEVLHCLPKTTPSRPVSRRRTGVLEQVNFDLILFYSTLRPMQMQSVQCRSMRSIVVYVVE